MASTYSPNLRIELIAVGEQSNTWGGTTNNNLGTLIEQAISGVVSIDVSAGNVTLTALQGATDQSRQMVIIATGTPGVTRTITAPAVNKVYSVVNNSNATLSFIASGGTGVTLVAGAKKYLYCDGTNFYDAINAVTVTSGTIDGTTIGATTPTTGKFTTVQSTVATGTAPFTVASTTPVANLNIGGNAATATTVTTNANLTGAVTSVGNATSLGSFTSLQLLNALTDETGTGSAVFATSPTLVTPALGTPSSGTLTSCTGLPISTGVSGLATGVATFLATPSSANLAAALTDETGSGSAVFATSPTLVTPALGTPSALVGTNITGTATNFTASNVTTNANLTGAVTSVGNATSLGSFTSANLAAALTDETGTGANVFATSPTLVTPALGTPSSGTLTSCTGLPISTGVSGLATGVATFLVTPTSANLAAALTDETGTGANVFANSPTLVTPALGTPSALVGTNITGTATNFTASNVTTNANLTGAVTSVGNATSLGSFTSANLAAALTDETGTGANVFATSPTLTSPVIAGTPTGVGVLTSGTAVASTSGTSINFTSIPNWAKRITVMFNGVSTSGASQILVQIGSGSVTTTGYLSYVGLTQSGSNGSAAFTTGFGVDCVTTATTNVRYGHVVITSFGSNTYIESINIGDPNPGGGGDGRSYTGGGSVTLSGTLDRIRITTVNGTDTFDAGSINIMYE